jgi:HAD superfamily hydrolase (TIGR01450 family)
MAPVALSPRLTAYDGVLLDLDGCLWVGEAVIEGAPDAVAALRDAGKAIAFLTNDPARSPDEYVRKLWRLGFRASAGEVVTVGTATEHWLAQNAAGSAFVIGSRALVDHVALAGLRIVNGTDLAARADVVVVAGHERFDYAELRTATQAVMRGALLVGTGRDATFPMPDGAWPGTGALLAAVETASGRSADVITGKPEPPMYDAARAAVGDGRLLAVGDRLDADVAGARAAGIDSALVLSGVTSALEGARADPGPTFTAPSLAALVLG